jgi:single-stranded DNA-binding protein
MMNLNEVTLMGTIEKIGDLRKPSYAMIEIVLNIKTPFKNKAGKWENKETKVSVTFFNQLAEEVAVMSIGALLLIRGEASTRFKMHNGIEYPTTSITGKKYQEIIETAPRHQAKAKVDNQQPLKLEEFEDDIPF